MWLRFSQKSRPFHQLRGLEDGIQFLYQLAFRSCANDSVLNLAVFKKEQGRQASDLVARDGLSVLVGVKFGHFDAAGVFSS